MDAARVAAAARLQERLHALHSSVYPAYANAYRPPPDTSSRPPTPRPSPDADDEHDDDAAVTGAAAATEAVDSHPLGVDCERLRSDDATWAEYRELLIKFDEEVAVRHKMAATFHKERDEMWRLHAKEVDHLATAYAKLVGGQDTLLEVFCKPPL